NITLRGVPQWHPVRTLQPDHHSAADRRPARPHRTGLPDVVDPQPLPRPVGVATSTDLAPAVGPGGPGDHPDRRRARLADAGVRHQPGDLRPRRRLDHDDQAAAPPNPEASTAMSTPMATRDAR